MFKLQQSLFCFQEILIVQILSEVAQQALNSHLEHLAALSLVAIIAHIIAIVG